MTVSNRKLKLVHISDPHLTSLENVRWRDLLNKRILGYLSWRLRRRHTHRPEILSRLQQDISQLNADHLIISGDLTHIGTEDECRQARSWLTKLNPPASTTVVPGNHDRYVRAAWQRTLGLWREYMAGEKNNPDSAGQSIFPALHRCGPIALIGLSTALPTPPFFASGRLGASQLDALDALLASLSKAGLFRIIVLHHGPSARMSDRRRGLDDARELREILQHRGAELVLHGHGHTFFHDKIEYQDKTIPIFGVPSASASGDRPEKRAGYNVYDIASGANHWRLFARSHVLNEARDTFEVKKEYEFALAK